MGNVAALARGKAGLAGARADVEATGQRSLAIDVAVSDHRAVTDAAAKIERELGEIDAWVNVAFVGTLAFAWDTPPEEHWRVMDVTFNGQVHGTLAALSFMRLRNLGTIVKVCSAMFYRSIPPKPLLRGYARCRGFHRVRHDRVGPREAQGQALNRPGFPGDSRVWIAHAAEA